MKSIQTSVLPPERLASAANESASVRSASPEESFGSRWNREVGSAERVVANPAPPIASARDVDPKTRTPGVKVSITDELVVPGTPDNTHGGFGPRKDLTLESESLRGAAAVENPLVRTRREHASPVPATGSSERAKQRDSPKRVISSNFHLTTVVGNDVPPITGAETSGSGKIIRSDPNGHGVAEIKGKETPKSLPFADTASPSRPEPQARAVASDRLTAESSKPEAVPQKAEVKGNAASDLSNTAKPRKEIGGFTKVDGLPAVASSSQIGLAMPALTPPQSTERDSGLARAGMQLSLTNTGAPATSTVPQTIVSTPVRLDVGVFNGTHGWLRVRAELGGSGGINASVTAIDSAHEALRAATPEMVSYLEVEAVKVNGIEVHRFTDASGAQSSTGAEGQPSGGQQNSARDEGMSRQAVDGVQASRPETKDDLSMLHDSDADPLIVGVGAVASWSRHGSGVMPHVMWSGVSGGVGTWLNVCA